MKKREVKQGEIYFCNLDGSYSEQCGGRPVLIVSVNVLNNNRDNVIIVPITSSTQKKHMINHFCLSNEKYKEFTHKNNIVLLECIRDISKRRLERKICEIDETDLSQILNLINYDFKEFTY